MIFQNDFFFFLPEIFWISSIIGLLIFTTSLTNKYKIILLTRIGYIYLFFGACFCSIYLQIPTIEYTLLNYQYVSDFFTFSVKLVFLVLMLICIYVSLDYYFFEKIFFVEYYFLLGLFCVSSFLLISANDLIMFYLAIELQSLILYTLAALKRYTVFSTEGGLKYFVLGALSSGFLLFAISLFYGFLGSLSFNEAKFLYLSWFDYNAYSAVVILAVMFLLSSILFKLAAAPFHIWTPDVYEGSPSAVVLIFSTLPKLAILAFFIRLFVFFLYDYVSIWYAVLFFSGILSVVIGTFAALNQFNIKRLYAYSAIVNVGYLVTSASFGTIEGFSSLINYFVVYLFSTLAIFLTLLLFRNAVNLNKIKYLSEYTIYATHSWVFSIFLGLIFFSLAGVPPLAGFFIKFFLFKTIFVADLLLNPAVFIILVTSVVSAFYYIRVVRFVFFSTKRTPLLLGPVNYLGVLIFVVACVFVLTFCLFQPLFIMVAEYAILNIYL